ncbi:MAG: cytochrome P450 [Dermatophilaceae bacterium]
MSTPMAARQQPRRRAEQLLPGLTAVARALPGDLIRGTRQGIGLAVRRGLDQPPLPVLALLRRTVARARVGPVTMLTRAADVRAVLRDPDRYTVRHYGAVMGDLIGPFALGLDGPAHTSARAVLAEAVSAARLLDVADRADAQARRLLGAAAAAGRLDIVTEFARPLTVVTVAAALGVQVPPGEPVTPLSGNDGATCTADWTEALFECCFRDGVRDRGVGARARAARDGIAGHFSTCVAKERARAAAGEPVPGEEPLGARPATPLAVLLERYEDDARVVADLVGLFVGSVPTIAESLARVIDHLLDHPDRLAAVREDVVRRDVVRRDVVRRDAGQGTAANPSSERRAAVWGHCQEAMRFAPPAAGFLRVPANGDRPVFASTLAAMHDPAVVPDPGFYRPGRPDGTYLHFGDGPHRCVGEALAREILTSALIALVVDDGWQRHPGPDGRLRSDGAFPSSLVLIRGTAR